MTSITRTEDDQADDAPFNRTGVRWHAVAWFLGIVVSVLVTYNATSATFDKRITVLESQGIERDRRMNEADLRMRRIEDKIDQLLDRR